MNKIELKKSRRIRTKFRIRSKISGTAVLPRITIFRSNKYIYAQVIDDTKNVTLASASSIKSNKPVNAETCKLVAIDLANKLKELKLDSAVFDRNGYIYTGRIKVFADSLRENGIKI
ncbi:MAG: 50S ribosomal protein L18 [Spirochaetes bacterium GWF1_31_7]|nr:MAG: 50S ribosomal protein L18 [Spirochaetes bacterium GWE1_32_154]OHD47306.1 MAG: 50S ribosomal protein L18 [Spirochaetes bacterium GWE2_31_10]OHD47365.1 MAG: 50S ribosomal protein L18 [Spirochaetes bacterium GWF1_31_7]OHD81751.1 MAG: 50S ribosomal protein L18 [Spirochaetes bacterium RIFOXYB1_FULL_32_8]HBD92818.1 50S ribosomal protein L18 [Spirochaetia bacterium]